MKRARATVREVRCIERWLSYPTMLRCPFGELTFSCSICFGYFPTLERKGNQNFLCPCPTYGKSYVKRVAKQLVKEFLERRNKYGISSSKEETGQ